MQLLPQSLNLGAALEVHILDAAQYAGLLAAQCLHRSLQARCRDPRMVCSVSFSYTMHTITCVPDKVPRKLLTDAPQLGPDPD